MLLFTRIKSSIKFILPCLLWLFIYRGFLTGRLFVSEDTFAIYPVVKYFLTNLKMGVFPHWNPFIHWGMGHICQVGEFNPMWLLTLLLNSLGMPLYFSFLWTIIVYMFVGAIGAYCVFKKLLSDEFCAYVGFLCFLFSGYSMTVFTQMTLVLLFVPSVWFFYFLIDFFQTKRISSFLFMAFCVSMVLTTYIPFYFLTVFLILFFLGCIFFNRIIGQCLLAIKDFIRSRPIVFLAGVLLIAGAMVIGCLNFAYLKTDFIAQARPTEVNYNAVKDSGIPISDVMRDYSLFTQMIAGLNIKLLKYAKSIFTLDAINFDNQRILYMPIVAHLLIILGLFTLLSRRIIVWACVCFILFLISITRLTSFYEYLFNHVFYFRIFRNVFCFIPFITMFYVLLALETSHKPLLWIFQKSKGWHKFLKGFLLFVLLASATKVMLSHVQKFELTEKSDFITEAMRSQLTKPEFHLVRPPSISDGLKPNDIYRMYNWHMIFMKDTDRFITFKYGYPTTLSRDLAQAMEIPSYFSQYVAHKFVVYDQFISTPTFNNAQDFLFWFSVSKMGTLVESEKDGIKVNKFDANHLEFTTQYATPKFLVYNDSYHPFWRACVNDKPVHILKVNYAFKGIPLPKGLAHVRFEFKPPGWILYILYLMFVYLSLCASFYLKWIKKV